MLPYVLVIRRELVLTKGQTVSGYWQLSTECYPMIARLKCLICLIYLCVLGALVNFLSYTVDIKEKMHYMDERTLKKCIIK